MSLPKAPDPNGPQPDDWTNSRRWIAYQAWATGKTRRQAAADSGYSFGHIGRLVADWRAEYDTTELVYREPGLSDEARQQGQEAAAVVSRLRWRDRRDDVAADIGDTISKTHTLLSRLVDRWLEQVDVLDPSEIRMLTRAILDMTKTADQLSGVPDSTRAYVVQHNRPKVGDGPAEDAGVDEHLLDGLLEGGGTPQDLLDALDVITVGFLEAATEIVDVE